MLEWILEQMLRHAFDDFVDVFAGQLVIVVVLVRVC
jgi:hypothetical protein